MSETSNRIMVKLSAVIEKIALSEAAIADVAEKVATPIAKKFSDKVKKNVEGDTNEGTSATTSSKGKGGVSDDTIKNIGKIAHATGTISDVGMGFIKKTFGFIESIYLQLKKSSPLLQAIEQLFNLAWTLFFMPLGNKLGEMLIPAIIQMMDDVMAIWDAFEGMSLGEMFAYAITKGAEMIGSLLVTIGDTLANQTGLTGAIGKMLQWMGNFITSNGGKILTTLIKVTQWILEHLPELIGTLIALKVTSIGLQITQIIATLSNSIFGTVMALAVTGGVALGVGSKVKNALNGRLAGFADGGYVPATPGGQLAIIGEGGEGEYIVPESKLGRITGNGGNYTINNYMMSTDELDRHIREVVRGEVSASKLRSGF